MARNVTTNINPQTTSGTQLSVFINDNTQAWLTHHTGGSTRPPYMIASGGIWVDTVTNPANQVIYYFDGSFDIPLGVAVNGQLFLEGGTIIFKQPAVSLPDPGISRINHFWYQTDTEDFLFLTSKDPDVWVPVGSGGGGGGVLTSADTQLIDPLIIVDGHNLTFPNVNLPNGIVKLDTGGLVPLANLPVDTDVLTSDDIEMILPVVVADGHNLTFPNTNLANGIVKIDAGGLIPSAILPPVVITSDDTQLILPSGTNLAFPNVNLANGLVKLTSAGLIPLSLLSFGGLTFVGGWDIQLGDPPAGTVAGEYFIGYNGPGPIGGGTANSGDSIIWDGAVWIPIEDADISLATLTGYDNNTSTLVAVEVSSALNEEDAKVQANKATMDAHIAATNIHFVINDAAIVTTSAWSSSKISADIGVVSSGLSSHIANAAIHFVIDDAQAITTVAWSGSKISADIGVVSSGLSSHISATNIHFVIDDLVAAANSAWSGAKISTDLGVISGTLNSHVSTSTIHFIINDISNLTTEVWSGNKITAEFTTRDSNLNAHTADVVIHNRAANNSPLRQYKLDGVTLLPMIKINAVDRVEISQVGVTTNIADALSIAGALTVTGAATVNNTFTVNGNTNLNGIFTVLRPADYWASEFIMIGGNIGWIGTNGSFATTLASNAYRNVGGTMTSLNANALQGVSMINLHPNGNMDFRSNTTLPAGTAPTLRMSYTGGTDTWLFTGDITISKTFTVAGNINSVAIISSGLITANAGISVSAGNLSIIGSTPTLLLSSDTSPTLSFDRPAGGSYKIQNDGGFLKWFAGQPGIGNATTEHMRLTTNIGLQVLVGVVEINQSQASIGVIVGSRLFFNTGGGLTLQSSGSNAISIVNADNTVVLFSVSSSGAVTATGNITAFSDRRVKDELKFIPNALEKVCKLKGYTYRRTDLLHGKDKTRYAGLIAQDVKAVLSEAVGITDGGRGGILTLDNAAVVGLLVNAISELREEMYANS